MTYTPRCTTQWVHTSFFQIYALTSPDMQYRYMYYKSYIISVYNSVPPCQHSCLLLIASKTLQEFNTINIYYHLVIKHPIADT